jgi:putative peptidoglycan lipid II flippase
VRRSVSQLFIGNFFSKALGLGREILTSALFGTGQAIGAYRVAQTGTLVPVHFFTQDSINAAFIPTYKRFLGESRDMAQSLFWSLSAFFLVLSLLIGAGLWLIPLTWIGILAPGLDSDTALLAGRMLQIMGLGVPFYLISSLFLYLGMGNDDFVPMAVRPSVQNMGLITGAVIAFYMRNALFFAWGFTASYILFCLWVMIRLRHSGYLSFPNSWQKQRIRLVFTTFWITLRPLLFLPFMLQGNIAVERAVATLIGLIAVSALDYARFVTETVIFLISIPVASVGLSSWSGLETEALRERLSRITILMMMVAVPASAFLASHSHRLVEVIYARGAFDTQSVQTTGDILFGISLGLWAQIVGYVLIKGLNAQMRNRTVMWIMAAALAANTLINLSLYGQLGAVTLGLGNTVYGLILLVGTLSALRLWREVVPCVVVFGLGVVGYLILNSLVTLPVDVVKALIVSMGFTLIYWFLWISAVPSLRQLLIEAFGPKQGRSM